MSKQKRQQSEVDRRERKALENVQIIHSDAFRLCPQITELPANLTGHTVKIPFNVPPPAGQEDESALICRQEYMWVKVFCDGGDLLLGILGNDPVLSDHLKNGDVVAFRRQTIVDIERPILSRCRDRNKENG
jgi:hypothetical protein